MRLKGAWLVGAVMLAAGGIGLGLAAQSAHHAPVQPPLPLAPSAPLMLADVTVVDPVSGKIAPGMDILTEKGRIVAVTASAARRPMPGVRFIEARGKFVVPGYNDLHAHVLGDDDPSGALALMLVNGITGFRQMSGSTQLLTARREGRLPIGRYGPALLAMPGDLLLPTTAATPDQAVATVRREKTEGADFIKVGLTNPESFLAAQAEAKRLGLPFAGHLQRGVDASAASRLGMRSMEHLGPGDTILVSCSTDEAALRAAIARRPPVKGPPFQIPAFLDSVVAAHFHALILNPIADADEVDVSRYRWIARTFSEQKCRALAAQFVVNGTWQVPTLVRERSTELGDSPEYASDPNLRYMPPEVVRSWRESADRFVKHQSAADKATFRLAYAMQLRLTKLFDDAGVSMMAGSDESGQWEVPGFSLHQEFDELAHAGLSPLRILQMTTINGARFLGRTGTMGQVAPGRGADLVILDGNPLDSVANLHAIDGVVRAGFYYSRADLDGILADIARGGGVFHRQH